MNENSYYSEKLSALRLKRCYEIASPRIKQYLEAEIQYVLNNHINPSDTVLEIGCGYGRVLTRLAGKAKKVYGIDTSQSSLELAGEFLSEYSNVELYEMNAKSLKFNDQMFDVVIAIQNGISVFQVDQHVLIRECLRVTKDGGRILLSSYSEKIWDSRLDWFIEQSKEGLLGEIDLERSEKGVIVCKDGFKATTYTAEDFSTLISEMHLDAIIEEVDQSSIFCTVHVHHNQT
jgi:2-polyprenyl-6-hydroxyphenyl methylase/3-demethylubiquinone-9 3-methyltransferase